MRHMTLNLLPDAEHYSHPLFSWFVAVCFDLAVGHIYCIERMIPRGHRLRAGTLVVSNHVRDSDIPILMLALCRRRGWRFHEPLPYFAAREDLLQRDALASLAWPSPRSRLLGLIPVGWFFRNLRVRPMRRLREFTLGDTVTELLKGGLGTVPPLDLFNARGQRELTLHPAQPAGNDIASFGLPRPTSATSPTNAKRSPTARRPASTTPSRPTARQCCIGVAIRRWWRP